MDSDVVLELPHVAPTYQQTASSSKFSMNRFIPRANTVSGNSQHRPSVSVSNASVRVVGRGGVGSRLRTLPSTDSASTSTSLPVTSHARRVPEGTRIMGRGGAGARPRQLESTTSFEDPRHPVPSPPAIVSTPTPAAPNPNQPPLHSKVVYRPTGRGGAGSRQPEVKTPSDPSKPRKGVKSLWKGKGRETDAVRPGMDALGQLTRVDSIATVISDIAFAPAPAERVPPGSSSSRTAHGFSKLARTLGMDDALGAMSARARAPRALRRGSISTLSTMDSSSSSRRDSGIEFLAGGGQQTYAASYLDLDVNEWARAMEMQRLASISAAPTTSRSPPRRPKTTSSHSYDDTDSDITTTDDSSILHTSDAQSISFSTRTSTSTSSAQLHAHPSFGSDISEDGASISNSVSSVDDDVEEDVVWSRSLTPTPRAMPGEEEEKPSEHTDGHDAYVVSPAWDGLLVRDEPAHGWSGQWNQRDMKDVLRGLRGLRA
ncbi:hypothetical protein FB45DRAFT_150035 [Roridomyces roridus]|uniref:Uncharacterized protein n=1 Tax=Roridomyces roridus TaxID=1738132 RepID=A0AAD7BGP0_9AGAR|nr:hypothetical protein FB45DRAFT_150035 [Roridomyces roridus]